MKPDENTIKINVNASVLSMENKYGYGCVARDHTGTLLEVKASNNKDGAGANNVF